MITREQVADLQPGDVVELRFPSGSVIRGPLTAGESYGPGLGVADVGWGIRSRDGEPGWFSKEGATLTVVSRAPRLYVNSNRPEPVPGDVVDYEDGHCKGVGPWLAYEDDDATLRWMSPHGRVLGEMPYPMRLLIDGETGLPPAVQS